MAQAMANPQAAMQQMLQSDPRIKNVLDMVVQNGGDAKSLFYQVASQKGVDPQSVLNEAQAGYEAFMQQMNMK